MITAFVFPGLDGVQRAVDFRPFLALPEFSALWQLAECTFGDRPDFRATSAALLGGQRRVLAAASDWRWPALAVAAMQIGTALALRRRGVLAEWHTGYSIGNVARTLAAHAAGFDDLLAFLARVPTLAPRADTGRAIVAFAADRRSADAALTAVGSLAPAASRLSDRMFALPVGQEAEPALRRALQGRGLRLFDLAPCGLHGPAWQPLADRLERLLQDAPLTVAAAGPRVFSSQTLTAITTPAAAARELAQNVAVPFDFAATVRRLHRHHGVSRFVNLGPGRHVERFVQHAGLPVTVIGATTLLPPRTGVHPVLSARSA